MVFFLKKILIASVLKVETQSYITAWQHCTICTCRQPHPSLFFSLVGHPTNKRLPAPEGTAIWTLGDWQRCGGLMLPGRVGYTALGHLPVIHEMQPDGFGSLPRALC